MKVRNMNNEKLEIIIDGANIFHDDRGIRTFDEEGEKITQSRPERLAAAIFWTPNFMRYAEKLSVLGD